MTGRRGKRTVISRPDAALRALTTAAGYRGLLVDAGREQDLDDAVRESRPESNAELLHEVEDALLELVETDCGRPWAELLSFGSQESAHCLRALANFERSYG